MLIGFGNLHLLIFWSSLSNKVHISKHGVTMKFRAIDPHISNSSEVDSVSSQNSKLTGELWKEYCKELFQLIVTTDTFLYHFHLIPSRAIQYYHCHLTRLGQSQNPNHVSLCFVAIFLSQFSAFFFVPKSSLLNALNLHNRPQHWPSCDVI